MKLSKIQKKALIKGGMIFTIKEISKSFESIIDKAQYLGALVLFGRSEWGSEFEDALKESGVMACVINACVKVAKGDLDPRLVTAASTSEKYIRIRAYRASVQKRILDVGVPALIPNSEGILEEGVIKFSDMNSTQTRQCLGLEGPKTIGEQRVYLESMATKNPASMEDSEGVGWSIEDGELVVNKRGARFSKKDLLDILAELL